MINDALKVFLYISTLTWVCISGHSLLSSLRSSARVGVVSVTLAMLILCLQDQETTSNPKSHKSLSLVKSHTLFVQQIQNQDNIYKHLYFIFNGRITLLQPLEKVTPIYEKEFKKRAIFRIWIEERWFGGRLLCRVRAFFFIGCCQLTREGSCLSRLLCLRKGDAPIERLSNASSKGLLTLEPWRWSNKINSSIR